MRREDLDMKDLGMKDQVALKLSVISLRSARVIWSQLEEDFFKKVFGIGSGDMQRKRLKV